jgi:hypothetical protein
MLENKYYVLKKIIQYFSINSCSYFLSNNILIMKSFNSQIKQMFTDFKILTKVHFFSLITN